MGLIQCTDHPAFAYDEDGPPAPMINLGVEFDGVTEPSWDLLLTEITTLRNHILELKTSGAVFCSRDGRFVHYHEPKTPSEPPK